MIEVENIHVAIGPVSILHDVSLRVAPGRLVTVIGANGAGKTTLLRTLSNLVRPRSGAIRFEGRPTSGMDPHRLARAGLVHVPQGRQIVPNLTVRDNLVIGADRVAGLDADAIAQGLEREFARFPVLKERQHILGGNLSGGEQQMLAVSRALMMRPKALLLDEPSLGLAPQVVRTILKALRQLADEGLAVLLVEQLALLALDTADEAHVLQRGHVALSGPARDLRRDRAVIESYLG
ncbi:ABC transporter ATP-binding protein [Xanthobacter dioxanivorans]|uniref:ABC transporter ATP-binding protein n=1 Tax=Xanthobacter dioxanivorans TaxID=2528964 RepID=A0A974PU80_9HYPH|nr:ABC transporter ATP-binding protein [Xanthobacter dioxanivorans]QRG09333.1 ABC transporter ATP-binding protein [Xanthobacter dioxanivorans]